MLITKMVVVAASCLIAVSDLSLAAPKPGSVRERHVIHAPIKYKIIHHHRIRKIPVVIKKHVHVYKQQRHPKPEEIKPVVEDHSYEDHNSIGHLKNDHHNFDDFDFKFPPYHGSYHEADDDYQEAQQSEEGDYGEHDY